MADEYKPYVCMMTNSTCYKNTYKMKVQGILWHSTGANNWNLRRYVQPLETDPNYQDAIDKLGKNTAKNDWNHIEKQAGLNAWIGKFKDGTVGAVQTMPWDYRPWGCGSGKNGSLNNGWIQWEIAEEFLIKNSKGTWVHYKDTPGDKEYAQKVWDESVKLTAYLCEMYNLDPLGTVKYNGIDVPVITDHRGSWELGMGSGHGDVQHWFPVVLGKTMADARQEVYDLMHKPHGQGWSQEDGKWYYYDESGHKVTGWQTIDGFKYYFDKQGVMLTGWQGFAAQKYYFKPNGHMATEWCKIDGYWYYFGTSGALYTSNWIKDDDQWYYVAEDGKMVIGWLDYNGRKYYLNASGAMVTGWKRIKKEWYYFNKTGAMLTGWQMINEKKYYLYPDGHMASAEWINGLWCDYNGDQGYEYKAEWKSNAKGKWWEDESGWYPKNTTQKIDGVEYAFDAKGYLIQ